jgi:CRP-like cAMP-binding protein
MIKHLASRVRSMVRQIEDLALCSSLHDWLDSAQPVRKRLRGCSRRDSAAIAAHLATTPETVSRALRLLEDAGAIRLTASIL